MSISTSILVDKINQAAKILGTDPDKLKSLIVSKDEIDDLDLIATVVSTLEVAELENMFETVHNGWGKRTAAAKIIKSFEKIVSDQVELPEPKESKFETLINSMKPIQNWSDSELLTAYIDSERDDLESELQRRSKGRRFVVLANETSDEIDVDASLAMLKKARKDEIPDMVKGKSGEVIFIYRIEEVHSINRIRHECPFDLGSILFDDYCSVCEINFSGVNKECRQMLRLISRSEQLDLVRKVQLVELAVEKGKSALDNLYPRVAKEFRELEMTDSLPSLVKLEKPKTRNQKLGADPFSVKEISDDLNRRGVSW